MKQVIPFKKEIVFKTMINKITSISLEHTLELKEFNIVSGDFIISGSYKMTEASQIDEDFSYKVPIEITIDGKYDTSNISLEIDDFTYEVLDEEKLSLNIDLCIDNLELKPVLEKTETLFTSDDYEEFNNSLNEIEKELEYEQESLVRDEDLFLETSTKQKLEVPVNINNFDDLTFSNKQNTQTNESIDNGSFEDSSTSIFTAFKDTDETFSTYSVYIIREGDNLDTILNKYKTTKDILMEYNDLSDIRIGTKIIVPSCNE